MADQHCTSCGAAVLSGQRFCSTCGHEVADSAGAPTTSDEAAPRPQSAKGGLAAKLQDPVFWADIRRRAGVQALGLVGVGLITFVDFNLHEQLLGALLVAAIGIGLMLFFREGVNWLMTKMNLPAKAISWVQPLFFSGPAALYFLTRGAGTVDNGAFLALGIGVLPLLANSVAPRFDTTLGSFYERRDRLIPTVARPFVLIGLTAIITFGLIHGSLGDIDILFGGTADKAVTPSSTQVLFTTVITVVIAFALMRTPAKD